MSALNSITSCCINDKGVAWVTAFGGWVFCNNQLYNTGAAWNTIRGTLSQIVCSKTGAEWLAGINTAGEVFFSREFNTIHPRWNKCTTAPAARYIHIQDNGICVIITKDNRLLSTTDVISGNSPFNITISPPAGVSVSNIVSFSSASDNWGTICVNNGLVYMAKNAYRNARPSWFDIGSGGRYYISGSYAKRDGHSMWVTSDNRLWYKRRWDNNSTIGSISTEKFNYISMSDHSYFIATTIDNKIFFGQAPGSGTTISLGNLNINNFFDLGLSIKNYITANPHASLTNGLSNPGIASASTRTESYIQKMAKKGHTDFTPFKVLTLYDLMKSGKAQKATWISPYRNDDNAFALWVMTFSDTDPYLPLGDVIVHSRTDIKSFYCILIQNKDEYRTKIASGDYKLKFTSWGRWEANWTYTWNEGGGVDVGHAVNYDIMTAVTSTTARIYKNMSDQFIIGDVFSGGNDARGAGNNGVGNQYYRSLMAQGGNWVEFTLGGLYRPFATVKSHFLSKLDSTQFDPTTNAICDTYQQGNGYKGTSEWKLWPTSPFNTFAAGGPVNAKNKLPDGYAYFDFLPEYLIAANCGIDTGTALRELGIITKITPVSQMECGVFMDAYTKKNNYENIRKKPVSDYCSLTKANCDLNLYSYCRLGPGGKIYTNKDENGYPTAKLAITATDAQITAAYPNSTLDMCKCFLPIDYGIAKDYNKMIKGGMSVEDAKEFTTLMIAGKAYQIPECYDTSCLNNKVKQTAWKNNGGTNPCRPIQICMNKATIDNAGTITGNVNIQQDNNCVATSQTTNQTDQGVPTKSNPSSIKDTKNNQTKADKELTTTTETESTESTNKTTIIIIIVLLSILGVSGFSFLLYHLFKAK